MSGLDTALPVRNAPAAPASLRMRLARRGLDGVTLLVLPAALFLVALFVYPFLHGLVASFQPKEGDWLPTTGTSSASRSCTGRSARRWPWPCRPRPSIC
jgi:hypothetical protein